MLTYSHIESRISMTEELKREVDEEFKRQQDQLTYQEALEEQEIVVEENPYIEFGINENDFH